MSDSEHDSTDMELEVEEQLVAAARAEAAGEVKDESLYNKTALLFHAEKLAGLPWIETLECSTFPLELENVHDDLKREVAFYNTAVSAVKWGKEQLKEQQIGYKRPVDYFAEMLKTDAHMAKVKDKLIYEQKKISAVEDRKQSVAHKRVAKKVQAEKITARQAQKKDTLKAVQQWKKRGKNHMGEGESEEALEAVLQGNNKRKRHEGQEEGAKPKGKGTKRADGSDHPSAGRGGKRMAKDKKFGYGGKKLKRNDTKSAHDKKDGFSRGRNNVDVPNRKREKVADKKRPGKSMRMQKSKSARY